MNAHLTPLLRSRHDEPGLLRDEDQTQTTARVDASRALQLQLQLQLQKFTNYTICVWRHSAARDLQADSVSQTAVRGRRQLPTTCKLERHTGTPNVRLSASVVKDAARKQAKKAAPIRENTQPPVCSPLFRLKRTEGKARQRCAMLRRTSLQLQSLQREERHQACQLADGR